MGKKGTAISGGSPKTATATSRSQDPNQRDEGGGEGGVRTAVSVFHTVGEGVAGIFGIPKSATGQIGQWEQEAITAGYDDSRKER